MMNRLTRPFYKLWYKRRLKKVDLADENNGVFDSTNQQWTDHDGVPTLPIETDLKD